MTIRKTPLMERIEAATKRDIRELIVEELVVNRTDRTAAISISEKVGFRIDPSTLSRWILMLDLRDTAEAARKARDGYKDLDTSN